jgi:hypothetical protein
MAHFWLCYRDSKQRFSVIIVEARSLFHARIKASFAGRSDGMIFTEGHALSAEMAPLIRPGRVLSADDAMELLNRLERKPAISLSSPK